MITVIKNSELGKGDHGWLSTSYHFSFADYYNPSKMGIKNLRVLNDDYIKPNTGFGTHPHRDMEIITYVINGELTHADSMGNEKVVKRGEVQYLSAGTGITHSEYNNSSNETCHLFQIWILPEETGVEPQYGDKKFSWGDRVDKLLHLVSASSGIAPIKIHQNSNIYATEISKKTTYNEFENSMIYVAIAEGSGEINGKNISAGDGIIIENEMITLSPIEKLHLVIIEL